MLGDTWGTAGGLSLFPPSLCPLGTWTPPDSSRETQSSTSGEQVVAPVDHAARHKGHPRGQHPARGCNSECSNASILQPHYGLKPARAEARGPEVRKEQGPGGEGALHWPASTSTAGSTGETALGRAGRGRSRVSASMAGTRTPDITALGREGRQLRFRSFSPCSADPTQGSEESRTAQLTATEKQRSGTRGPDACQRTTSSTSVVHADIGGLPHGGVGALRT